MTDSTVMHWKLESIYLLLINVQHVHVPYTDRQTDRQTDLLTGWLTETEQTETPYYNCVESSNKFELFHVNNSFYPGHIICKGIIMRSLFVCLDKKTSVYTHWSNVSMKKMHTAHLSILRVARDVDKSMKSAILFNCPSGVSFEHFGKKLCLV